MVTPGRKRGKAARTIPTKPRLIAPSRPQGPCNPHLIAWGEHQRRRGVPLLLVILAQNAALEAGHQSQLVELLTSGRLKDVPLAPDSAEWEQLYRHPEYLFETLGNGLDESLRSQLEVEDATSGFGTMARQFSVGVRRRQRMSPDDRREQFGELITSDTGRAAIKEVRAAMEEAWRSHVEALANGDGDTDTQVIETAEGQFFLRVWFPCWALYGEGAHQLFQAAETGNPEAFEKLLRVDKRILQFPWVARRLDHWQVTGNRDVMELIGKAMCSFDELKTSVAEQKLKTVAMIGEFASQFAGVPGLTIAGLSWEQIRSLFDAVAKDAGKLRDEDLPASNEALRKAANRMKKRTSTKPWDIFRTKVVP